MQAEQAMKPASPAEVAQALDEAVRRLREALDPILIYAFGSHVYGSPEAHSDLDLLVVVADSAEHPFDRDARAYRALCGIPMPIDVQVYTRDEFERRAALPVSFERTVKQRGKIVYAA